MSEEKLKVLEMLDSGKISFDEAMTLLDKVREAEMQPAQETEEELPPPAQEKEYEEFQEPCRPNNWDFSWIGDIRSAIEETTSAIGNTIDDIFSDGTRAHVILPHDFFYGTRRERLDISSRQTGDDIRALVFEAKNAPLTLESYGGDRIEVEAYYKVRSGWDPRLSLGEDDGAYSLSYDDNALYMLGLNIRVPETAKLGEIRLKNKNGAVRVESLTAEKIKLTTKNEKIIVSGIKSGQLFCETKMRPSYWMPPRRRKLTRRPPTQKYHWKVSTLHASGLLRPTRE